MARENSKAARRRYFDGDFHTRYFVGHGIDIGGKPDPLSQYVGIFPRMESVRIWDLEDGDAQDMAGLADESFDFVHASHCLEHLRDPRAALRNWLRIVKPGGFVVVTVPDEDLYELGFWPSRFNADHKWTFTICKKASWSPVSLNVVDLVQELADASAAERIRQVRDFFREELAAGGADQTQHPATECAIEFVLRKHSRSTGRFDAGALRDQADKALGGKRYKEAVAPLRRLCCFEPGNGQNWFKLGCALNELNRQGEAIGILREAVRLQSDLASARNNLGNALAEKGKDAEAEQEYRATLQLQPSHFNARLNLAMLLGRTNRCDEALGLLRQAIEARPKAVMAWTNYGVTLLLVNAVEDAIAAFRHAVALRPGDHQAHFNLAVALLLAGRFEEAWPEYKWRVGLPYKRATGKFHVTTPGFAQPEWDGGPLQGKTILLLSEQGYGDAIQFCRFVPLLAAQGARVVMAARSPLLPLLGSLAGLSEAVSPAGAGKAAFDCWAHLLDIPGRLGMNRVTDIPSRMVPYLAAKPELAERWRAPVEAFAAGRKIVGLAWAGNPQHTGDARRSICIKDLAPLAAVPGACFVALSRDRRAEDWVPDTFPLLNTAPAMKDFADTAALVALCDLVISVDSAPLHLAGAMGRPAWALLPFSPDWRWLLGRDDTPWYPSMRLFRQPSPGNWDAAVSSVAKALAAFQPARAVGETRIPSESA